jgi:hypothetical protein
MHLTAEKSYLVLSSDGVFERMELQDVCNLFHASAFLGLEKRGEKLDLQLLADTIVESALTSGSFDNLAVLIYPLELSGKIIFISRDMGTKSLIRGLLLYLINFFYFLESVEHHTGDRNGFMISFIKIRISFHISFISIWKNVMVLNLFGVGLDYEPFSFFICKNESIFS